MRRIRRAVSSGAKDDRESTPTSGRDHDEADADRDHEPEIRQGLGQASG